MKKTILLASLAFGMTALASVPTNVPSSGLVGYWSLAGNGNDETTLNTCTTYNSAGTADRYGISGAASTFNGTSDYIEIADNPGVLSGMADLSISVWAKTNTLNGTQCMVAKWWQLLNPNGDSDTYEAAIDYGTLQFATSNNNYGMSSPPSLISGDIGTWRHFVFVFDHNVPSLSVYVDGSLLHSESVSASAIVASTNALFFGADVDGYHYTPPMMYRFFDGDLDDIGIWDRPLTDCEILALYAPEARPYQARPLIPTGFNQPEGSQHKTTIGQNEPNPFNVETSVSYKLPAQVKNATLVIYDLTGAKIASIPLKNEDSSVKISSDKLAVGVYIYSIVADDRKIVDSKRMVVAEK